MVAGRSSEARSVTVTTTLSSTAVTAAAGTFREEDTGRTITGAGIPAGVTLVTTSSDTAGTLSAAATAAGTVSAALGGDAAQVYGFSGWSPLTDVESESYTLASVNAGVVTPDRITNATTAVAQRSRD